MDRKTLTKRSAHDTLHLVQRAIDAQRRITITYGDDPAARELSPYEVRPSRIGYARSPVTPDLVAWDHGREGYRTFKLDGIVKSAMLDTARQEVQS